MDEEYLKRLGLSIARGVPQMATGFVDLAALPFTLTGLLEPEQAVGSTAYLTSKGLLPPPQEGVIPETLEMVSGSLSPQGALSGGLLGLGTLAGARGARTTRLGDLDFDPRFDPRVKEQPRIQDTTVTVQPTANVDAPTVSLTDFEGYPFITSMSDRTAAGGLLTAIDDVALKRPVTLPGGQDFMFLNPGMVWASGKSPVKQIMDNADVLRQVTGRDPLYLPWRMAPTGGDFATMTGETMLSFAESALPRTAKRAMDKAIKAVDPTWKGIDSVDMIKHFRSLPDKKRKSIKKVLDVNFRDAGGLSIGQARLAVADPRQVSGTDAQIMNIGRIFADQPVVSVSGHASYPRGVPGEGLGRVDRDINIFELLPRVVQERGIPNPVSPRTTDIRALQMKPYAGILDEQTLRNLGY
jgi:hypothetical protein